MSAVAEVGLAQTLFARRSTAVRPGCAVTPANTAGVAVTDSRLDGLPPAVRSPAARANLLSPSAQVERLRQRPPLVKCCSRDRPERLRSLRGTVA